MSLSTLLFGNKPTRQGPSGAEFDLMRQGDELYYGAARQGYSNLGALAQRAAILGRGGERRAALGRDAADVAMGMGRAPAAPNQDVIGRALTRARGLSRLQRHTSDEFDANLQRERIGLVAGARQRMGGGLAQLAAAAGNQAQLDRSALATRDAHDATRQQILGTAIGAATNFVPEIRQALQFRRFMGDFDKYGVMGS